MLAFCTEVAQTGFGLYPIRPSILLALCTMAEHIFKCKYQPCFLYYNQFEPMRQTINIISLNHSAAHFLFPLGKKLDEKQSCQSLNSCISLHQIVVLYGSCSQRLIYIYIYIYIYSKYIRFTHYFDTKSIQIG